MTSRDRVLETLRGRKADRVPLNVFAGWNPGIRALVEERHGSLDGFSKTFAIDAVTGVLPRFPFGRRSKGEVRSLPDDIEGFLDLEPFDASVEPVTEMPCDGDLFPTVAEAVASAGERAVIAHAWGVFELSQFLFEVDDRAGTEDALLAMLAERDACRELFNRLGEWTADSVDAAIAAGADVIELSDDWGQQKTMLFSPDLWWDLVFGPTSRIVKRAAARDTPVIIHSDGDVSLVLDGIRDLGIQGLHPVQESAGMNIEKTRTALGSDICIMGGLDTVNALPRMNETEIRDEVRRVFGLLKESGPFIFAGSHMFQDDTRIQTIEAAYRCALEIADL